MSLFDLLKMKIAQLYKYLCTNKVRPKKLLAENLAYFIDIKILEENNIR